MKIGIIGSGFVGGAVVYAHRNQELVIRDPKLGEKSASLEEIKTCDAVYVCVPSPMLEDGHCDDSYIRTVLKELAEYSKVIICKSTIPPGVYASLQEHYPNIVHAPEFLTAANANLDYVNATWMLVGGTEQYVDEAIEVIKLGDIAATHYHKTNITTASLFKYIANSFLATKVTFMNEMYRLASQVNVDWSEIKTIAKNDTRLGNSHWDVPGPDGWFGYGGACFPKDVSAIVEHSIDIGTSLELLNCVKNLNEVHRKISL
jgi:nucleotide sugar dehydrogenase